MRNKLYFTSNHPKAQAHALKAIIEEQNKIGYYALPDQDITPILNYAKQIPDHIEDIAVIGIGGSSFSPRVKMFR